jgi:hypothetical protein
MLLDSEIDATTRHRAAAPLKSRQLRKKACGINLYTPRQRLYTHWAGQSHRGDGRINRLGPKGARASW